MIRYLYSIIGGVFFLLSTFTRPVHHCSTPKAAFEYAYHCSTPKAAFELVAPAFTIDLMRLMHCDKGFGIVMIDDIKQFSVLIHSERSHQHFL